MRSTEMLIPTETKIIFCRTEYCEKCFQQGRPKQHDIAVVYGSTSGKYKLIDVSSRGFGVKGFTPHIIQSNRVDREKNIVLYYATCGICGVEVTLAPERKLKILRQEVKTLSIKAWNEFVKFKDPQYRVFGMDV